MATAAVRGEPTPLLRMSSSTSRITPDRSRELGDKAAPVGRALALLTTAAPLTPAAVAAVLLLTACLPHRRRQRAG